VTLVKSLVCKMLSLTHRWCFLPPFRGQYRVRAVLVRLCQLLQAPGCPVALHLLSGISIWTDIHHGMTRWILTNDIGETATAKVLDEILRSGDMVVDVGANIGYFSLLSARRIYPNGRVFAFEPGARARRAMMANVALNRWANIISISDAAVGERRGRSYLQTFRAGCEHLSVLKERAEREGNFETVPVVSIDETCAETEYRVKLIKVDVEGREWEVLRGADSTIRRWKPYLIVELSVPQQTRFGYDPDEVAAWILDRSYRLSTIGVRRVPYQRSHLKEAQYIDVLAEPI